MSSYDKKDAAKDTGSSVSETTHAWHDAKDHAQKAGELPERKKNKEEKSKK